MMTIRWIVVRQCDAEPAEIFPFEEEGDALAFYADASVNWTEVYLTRVVHGPGPEWDLLHSRYDRRPTVIGAKSHLVLHWLESCSDPVTVENVKTALRKIREPRDLLVRLHERGMLDRQRTNADHLEYAYTLNRWGRQVLEIKRESGRLPSITEPLGDDP